MKLHIVAPDIRAGDAVGNHCLYLAEALNQQGIETTLYAKRHSADQKVKVLDLSTLLKDPTVTSDDVLLLSYSTFQPRLTELLDMGCRRVVYFHGVTPVEHLLDHDPVAAYWSARALKQLPMLARCDHIIANSQWNLADLLGRLPTKIGVDRMSVLPPITPDMPLFRKSQRGRLEQHEPLRLLTVGRLAPHKRLDDVVRMTALLCQRGVPTTLTAVGSATSPDYAKHLAGITKDLGMAASVEFRGHLTDQDLAQCFTDADFLVSASLHEGFCIPVLEAMHLGLPVVLLRGTAASEVARGAGLEFGTPEEGAAGITRLMADKAATDRMVRNGHARALELLRDADLARLTDILNRD